MSEFASRTAAAAQDLRRSAVDAGIKQRPGVPLHRLNEAYARALEVMGQTADAVFNGTEDIKRAAVAELHSSLRDELALLINNSGGDLAFAEGQRQARFFTIAIAVGLITVGLGAYFVGNNAGYKAGYASVTLEKKVQSDATAWATTSEGLAAYQMYQNGDLRKIITCGAPGWVRENYNGFTMCWAKPSPDGKQAYGWTLPR